LARVPTEKTLGIRRQPVFLGGKSRKSDSGRGVVAGLAGEEFGDGGKGVDARRRLVGPAADDTGEAEGVAAGVAAGLLDVVEGDFDDNEGLDGTDVAMGQRGCVP
jgi:hypothetical protein